MRIKRAAKAGREDTDDLIVELEPIEGAEIELQLNSSVTRLFGKHLNEYIMGLLAERELEGLRIKVTDNGALDFVIKARIEAALRRAEIIER